MNTQFEQAAIKFLELDEKTPFDKLKAALQYKFNNEPDAYGRFDSLMQQEAKKVSNAITEKCKPD